MIGIRRFTTALLNQGWPGVTAEDMVPGERPNPQQFPIIWTDPDFAMA